MRLGEESPGTGRRNRVPAVDVGRRAQAAEPAGGMPDVEPERFGPEERKQHAQDGYVLHGGGDVGSCTRTRTEKPNDW